MWVDFWIKVMTRCDQQWLSVFVYSRFSSAVKWSLGRCAWWSSSGKIQRHPLQKYIIAMWYLNLHLKESFTPGANNVKHNLSNILRTSSHLFVHVLICRRTCRTAFSQLTTASVRGDCFPFKSFKTLSEAQGSKVQRSNMYVIKHVIAFRDNKPLTCLTSYWCKSKIHFTTE